eukprot:3782668-Prymnesium_polylepis.2
MLHNIDTAKETGCGGLSKVNDGTAPDKPVWIMLSMDGAGLTNGPGESGVRLVFYLGSVERMNQSRHGITNLVTYKAAQHAESYETLQARCSSVHVRKQLCQIHNRQYIERSDGGRCTCDSC